MPNINDKRQIGNSDSNQLNDGEQGSGGENARRSGTQARGFASMDPERQRQIASQGGRAAHAQGTAHEFTPEEARNAGRKGGETVSQNRAHMAEIGRRGGEARGASARARASSSDSGSSASNSRGAVQDQNRGRESSSFRGDE